MNLVKMHRNVWLSYVSQKLNMFGRVDVGHKTASSTNSKRWVERTDTSTQILTNTCRRPAQLDKLDHPSLLFLQLFDPQMRQFSWLISRHYRKHSVMARRTRQEDERIFPHSPTIKQIKPSWTQEPQLTFTNICSSQQEKMSTTAGDVNPGTFLTY